VYDFSGTSIGGSVVYRSIQELKANAKQVIDTPTPDWFSWIAQPKAGWLGTDLQGHDATTDVIIWVRKCQIREYRRRLVRNALHTNSAIDQILYALHVKTRSKLSSEDPKTFFA
jgi:predicted NAD/FAD-dependent oxidoreductase